MRLVTSTLQSLNILSRFGLTDRFAVDFNQAVSILVMATFIFFFFFSSRRRHTRSLCDWSSDVCSSDLAARQPPRRAIGTGRASMAWNQSSDDQDATTRRGAARSPKLGGWLRRWRQRWSANPGARSPYYAAAATAALALWLATGFYQVDDRERGVLQRV